MEISNNMFTKLQTIYETEALLQEKRHYIYNKFNSLLNGITYSTEEIFALLHYTISRPEFKFSERTLQFIRGNLSLKDKNILMAKQVLNSFAFENRIRYEDSIEVFNDILENLMPKN